MFVHSNFSFKPTNLSESDILSSSKSNPNVLADVTLISRFIVPVNRST